MNECPGYARCRLHEQATQFTASPCNRLYIYMKYLNELAHALNRDLAVSNVSRKERAAQVIWAREVGALDSI